MDGFREKIMWILTNWDIVLPFVAICCHLLTFVDMFDIFHCWVLLQIALRGDAREFPKELRGAAPEQLTEFVSRFTRPGTVQSASLAGKIRSRCNGYYPLVICYIAIEFGHL